MPEYDFEIPRIIEEIKKEKAKRVGLQFPEGLKRYAIEIAKKIEKETAAETIIFVGPTYGACDLVKEEDAKKLKLDLVIHFGHSQFKPDKIYGKR